MGYPKPRLAHVTTVPITLGFFRGQIGFLKRSGFDVCAVTSPDEASAHFAAEQDIPVYDVLMNRAISPLSDMIALWRLWRLFLRLRPDIVHSHTPKAGLLGTLAARVAGVKVVFLSIFGLVQMNRTGFAKTLLDWTTRLSCSLANRVWCDSFSMRDHLIAEGLCLPSKVFVVGKGSVCGVDAVRAFSPENPPVARAQVRQQLNIPPGSRVLGFTGRIVRDKGMHELAEAWRTLREHYTDLYLVLVGAFEAKDPLSPEDARLFRDDPRIRLTGHTSDVVSYYAVMDVYVMPSYREGFGLTNIEAAAMGLPVVATLIPGCIDSVQDGTTGTLVPSHHVSALTEAIRTYLDDVELRQRHGQAGRARVLRDFLPEVIWKGLTQEYIQSLRTSGIPIPWSFQDTE